MGIYKNIEFLRRVCGCCLELCGTGQPLIIKRWRSREGTPKSIGAQNMVFQRGVVHNQLLKLYYFHSNLSVQTTICRKGRWQSISHDGTTSASHLPTSPKLECLLGIFDSLFLQESEVYDGFVGKQSDWWVFGVFCMSFMYTRKKISLKTKHCGTSEVICTCSDGSRSTTTRRWLLLQRSNILSHTELFMTM